MSLIRPEILAFIVGQEQFRAAPYVDNGGALAVGFGHSTIGPPAVTAGMTVTYAEAEAMLDTDLTLCANRVLSVLKPGVTLTDWQLGACASLVYNIGFGNFKRSSVLTFINSDEKWNFEKAANAMLDWCKAKDKVTGERKELLGLKTRRIIEASFFLHRKWT